MRRLLIRGGLLGAWIGLGLALFLLYRGHTLLVDNRSVENPPLIAPEEITVSVDGGLGLEFFRGDRDRFSVTGSQHWIRLEFRDGTQALEKTFTLPLKNDMYLLSIPKLINGIEPFVEVFTSAGDPQHEEEEP